MFQRKAAVTVGTAADTAAVDATLIVPRMRMTWSQKKGRSTATIAIGKNHHRQ